MRFSVNVKVDVNVLGGERFVLFFWNRKIQNKGLGAQNIYINLHTFIKWGTQGGRGAGRRQERGVFGVVLVYVCGFMKAIYLSSWSFCLGLVKVFDFSEGFILATFIKFQRPSLSLPISGAITMPLPCRWEAVRVPLPGHARNIGFWGAGRCCADSLPIECHYPTTAKCKRIEKRTPPPRMTRI